ncbi:MAG TPA: SagB/ThcOx family dehydrogenase [Allosphingosinicella sp.]|nr:SagB/ThcOx family dehydrogenase [Allosphingosinicella sp.]
MNAMTNPWFTKSLDHFTQDESEALTTSIAPYTNRHVFDDDALHEHFHEQTKYHRRTQAGVTCNIRNYLENPNAIARGAASQREVQGYKVLDWPQPLDLDSSLADALAKRASTRRADLAGSISAAQLSTLLHHGVRANRMVHPTAAPAVEQWMRPYPSGGALFPIELYVASAAVEGLPPAVSYYDARRHELRVVPGTSITGVRSAETADEGVAAAPCTLILTGVFERSVQKYGPRGYRLALIEAGHMMQNISLLAVALGLKALVSGSFFEAEMEHALDIDGVSEAALALVIIGS